MAQQPTTTSFAILSLLAVRPWTAYELAQQMDRSVGNMWPRAASVVYEEPKRLVQLGLASSATTYTGRRSSTVYTITSTGRRALARWLAEPGAGPTTEFEALVKVAFADHGSIEGLRANLAAVRAWVDAEQADGERRLHEYAETGGPYPDRLPVIALAAKYFTMHLDMLRAWVDWAEAATGDWTGVTPESGASVPDGAFDRPARPRG